MSELDDLRALQGKTLDAEARKRIESRTQEIAERFFKPAEPRPPIPEPQGKTDFYHMRIIQGYVDESRLPIGPAVFAIAVVVAVVAAILLL